ncbi:hypothetical protein TrST_g8329 [Triparma strigata]|uniref:Uncharacterized protein n=1 Tax=Triparma strigata TaxID=1606541 RepID=A0A9W7F0E6_9STRA|nr:hypothetical protein TrST_g8329 [Triparma strigata]
MCQRKSGILKMAPSKRLIVCQFVPDLRSLRSLAESCVYFNVIVNSMPADKLVFKCLFLKSVNDMEPDWNEIVRGDVSETMSWRSKCIMMWTYRSQIIDLPHSRIYAPGPGPLLGIGYFGCKLVGPDSLVVWGDFNGIRVVSGMGTATAPPVPAAIPTVGFNQNQNNASRTPALTSVGSNHGQVLSVLSHPLPSNPAMYLSMSSGHVLCVPAPLNNTPLGEGTFVPYNYNAVAHSESEVNSLSSLDDSILLSSSFDGTVCVWPNALSEIKMDTFQVLAKNVDPNPYNIGVTTSLPLQMEASGDVGTFVLGDNRGRVELWMKTYSGDAVGERESAGLTEGGGYVDLTHMYERLHQVEGCRNVASVYPEDQGSITCLTLMSGSGDYFASANNYGEIRTWKIHGQGSGSRLKPRHVLERAHSCAIDNLKVLGSLVVTTGGRKGRPREETCTPSGTKTAS